MTLTTRNVIIDVTPPSGTEFEAGTASIVFTLTRSDVDLVDDQAVPNSPISAALDASGQATVALWSNQRGTRGSVYEVKVVVANSAYPNRPFEYLFGYADIPDAVGDIDLSDIVFSGLDANTKGFTTLNSRLRTPDGSASLPAFSFASDIDTGMYLKADGSLGFSSAGSERVVVSSASVSATVPITTSGAMTAGSVTTSGNLNISDKIVHTGDTNTSIRFPAADTVTVETAGSERMRIDSSGNVGIGTSSPADKLAVDGDIGLLASVAKFNLRNGDALGFIDVDAPEISTANTIVRFFRNTNTTGDLSVRFHTGDGTASTDHLIACGGGNSFFNVNGGNVGIGTTNATSKLTVNGSLSKSSGSFRIDHPLKPDTHSLVHSFIEGPQADNIYRGAVVLAGGTATVNLDEVARLTEGTFVALNGNVQCFTSNEDGWTQVRGSVTGNILTIEAQDQTCTDTVSWLVIGERHDQHMIEADWTDESGRIITEPYKAIGDEE